MKKSSIVKIDRLVKKKFLVFGQPRIDKNGVKEIVNTIKSNWLSTGPRTKEFENLFKEYKRTKYAIAVNSCSSGLFLALKAFGIKVGDEVITTPISHPSTSNVILNVGAKPVFADIDLETGNISPVSIKKKITKKTKAIIPVHLAGLPCDIESIMAIAKKHKLKVIEDAAHAIESEYKGIPIGSFGDAGVFSFYSTKNITTGEGGMIITNNKQLAEKIRLLSFHGITKTPLQKFEKRNPEYDVVIPGYSLNMTDLLASLAIHQLKNIEANRVKREKYWKMYNFAFKDIPEIRTPIEIDNIKHARHLYSIILQSDIDRNKFINAIEKEGIGSGIHFLAIHELEYYKRTFKYKKGSLPNAESYSERTVSLPLSPHLTKKDVKQVIEAVKKTLSR